MLNNLTEELVSRISDSKNEPEWMLQHRLKCLKIFDETPEPEIGVDLSGLNLNDIDLYLESEKKVTKNWNEVPEEIREDFEALDIPIDEQAGLSGVGLQYDSELVYENLGMIFKNLGIVFMSLNEALRNEEYADIVREYFMKLVKPENYKYAALHGAVWSGGVFVYIPKGVSVSLPIQAYYRFNAPGAGQFEHSIIIVDEGASLEFIEGCSAPKYNVANLHIGCVEFFIKKNAHLKYGSVVNWSKNMYNLTTKCLLAEEGAKIEWISGVFGCKTSVLCPKIILGGENASLNYNGVTMADFSQDQNSGVRVEFLADNCTAHINSKSISQNGGKNVFRSFIKSSKDLLNCASYTNCESLLLDSESSSDAIPNYEVYDGIEVSHEAKVGRISAKKINYLATRGISEEMAEKLVVCGFIDSVSSELPFEYAQEMNKLIRQKVRK